MKVRGREIQRRLNDFRLTSGVTHLLMIPLATRVSRPQLASSLGSLANDACAASIPKEAFKWLDSIRLSFGSLSLPSQTAFDSATSLVQEVVARHTKFRDDGRVGQEPDKPLEVTLQGLVDDPTDPNPSNRTALRMLVASIIEPTGRLLGLHRDLVESLRTAGLYREGRKRELNFAQGAAIVDTSRTRTNELDLSPKYTRHGIVKYEEAKFDATNIHEHYKDHTWAKDFPVERLSLYETGLKHVVRDGILIDQGHREVFSVPLPGSHEPVDHQEACTFFAVKKYEKKPPPYIIINQTTPGQPKDKDFSLLWRPKDRNAKARTIKRLDLR